MTRRSTRACPERERDKKGSDRHCEHAEGVFVRITGIEADTAHKEQERKESWWLVEAAGIEPAS